jgi:hypothetical protein
MPNVPPITSSWRFVPTSTKMDVGYFGWIFRKNKQVKKSLKTKDLITANQKLAPVIEGRKIERGPQSFYFRRQEGSYLD